MNARFYAAATLVAALSVALPASAADSRLLDLVMPDANVVAGVNVNRAKATPFGQYVLAQIAPHDQELQKMVSMTGFDPRLDVSELLVASHADPRTAASPAARKEAAGLALAVGNFDFSKISAAVASKGGKTETYGGATLFEDPNQKSALAILDGSIAVFGDVASVKAAIDRKNGARTSALPSDFYGLISSWSASQDAWAVSNLSPALLKPPAMASQAQALTQPTMWQTVQSAAGGINFALGSNVVASIEAYSDTSQNAASMAGALQLLANMAKLQTSNNPQAATLLSSLAVTSDANVVKMTLSLPADQFQKLVSPRPKPAAGVKPGRPAGK
jgi:hypothetical protein